MTKPKAQPKYVQRFGRVLEALQILELYPKGILLADLARVLNTRITQLRDDLQALNLATESVESNNLFVEFLSELPSQADGFATDTAYDQYFVAPAQARYVRLGGLSAQLGQVQRLTGGLSYGEVAQLLEAADPLLRVNPGNMPLLSLVSQLQAIWFPGLIQTSASERLDNLESSLRSAIETCTMVQISYERNWRPGKVTRVVHPYQLVLTRRGFELDAGPVQPDGRIRTYEIDSVLELKVLEDTFARPANANELCQANRDTIWLKVVVPRKQRWALETLSEDVRISSKSDRDDIEARVELREPFLERAGLLAVNMGPAAMIVAPPEYQDAGTILAQHLLRHHGLDN